MSLKQYIRDSAKEYMTIFKSSFAKKNGETTEVFNVKAPTSYDHAMNVTYGDARYANKQTETKVNRASYFLAGYYNYIDSVNRTYTNTSYGDGWLSPTIYTSSSETEYIELFYHIPMRNDANTWGGVKSRLYRKIDGGDWIILGEDVHGGSVMTNGAGSIGMLGGQARVLMSGHSSIQFYFTHSSFDGIGTINDGCGKTGNMLSNFIIKEYRKAW